MEQTLFVLVELLGTVAFAISGAAAAPVEPRLMGAVGLALCALSLLIVVFPRVLAYPAAALGLWGGLVFLWRAVRLHAGTPTTHAFGHATPRE